MKIVKYTAAVAALTVSSLTMADSGVIQSGSTFDKNQLIPSGVRAEVGTTGYGGAILWSINPYVGLALGYNGGDISWSDDLKVNGSKYDMDMDNKTAYLNAEIRPWGASDNTFANSFYVAAGIGYIDNDYDLDRRVGSSRNFSVNGKDFQSTADGAHIAGSMKYDNDIAPYVGLGIAPKFNKNWGVFGEVGAYYTGNPKASLRVVSGGATSNAGYNLEEELAHEERKIQDKSRYEWMPVGKVGVNFYW
ncbi:ornithine uptake porin CarO [Acinetobacter rudis]|uniref:Outer membrane protein beta-barrel domain-containing protein n=1 Tax=Acinetobacter rudis CIP 110305 TaxID=421052 RepID=S3NFQ3_9GAMM|nr:ornithine uptake porin CarO [Acinetobacter rudis]EPF77328.1 hypothetical protein F945_00994 [Acinetobacter rudis CIP 110305]